MQSISILARCYYLPRISKIILLLTLANTLITFYCFSSSQKILIPLNMSNTVILGESLITSTYLESLTSSFASLILNTESQAIFERNKKVLQFVTPESHEHINNLLSIEEEYADPQYKKVFIPQGQPEVDIKKLKGEVKGFLITYFGKEAIQEDEIIFKASFKRKGVTYLLDSFKRVTTQRGKIRFLKTKDS